MMHLFSSHLPGGYHCRSLHLFCRGPQGKGWLCSPSWLFHRFTHCQERQREESYECMPGTNLLFPNRKATCDIWLHGGTPGTCSASHCWGLGGTGALEHFLTAGPCTRFFLYINSLSFTTVLWNKVVLFSSILLTGERPGREMLMN